MMKLDTEAPKIRMLYPGIVVLTVSSFFTFWQILFFNLILEYSKTIHLLEIQLITFSGQALCILFVFFILAPRLELKPFFESYDELVDKNPILWWVRIIVFSYFIAFTVLTSMLTLLKVLFGESIFPNSTDYLEHLLNFKNFSPPLGSNQLITIIALFLVYCVTSPIFEELLFRRILIPLLSENYPSNAAPVLISAIIFASLQTQAGVGPIEFIMANFLKNLIAGLMFGYVYISTRRLAVAILSHSIWNLIEYSVIVVSYYDENAAFLLPVFQVISFLIIIISIMIFLYLLIKKLNFSNVLQDLLSLFNVTVLTNIFLAIIITFFLLFSYLTQNIFLLILVSSVGLNIILFFYGATPDDLKDLKGPEPRVTMSVSRRKKSRSVQDLSLTSSRNVTSTETKETLKKAFVTKNGFNLPERTEKEKTNEKDL
ncbi:MAG: CPBP family intramembrane glutamic endopeptidase [Candidatus Hodarchaeales archaeon]|jgi:membrane protease YdiL (CAAX protease family)